MLGPDASSTRLSSPTSLLVAFALFAVLSCGCSRRDDSASDTEGLTHEEKGALQIAAAREKLSREVWAQEQEAQDYERAFIRLWDVIRGARDRGKVLKDFSFDELKLGREAGTEARGDGVSQTNFEGEARVLSHEQWARWLDELAAQGLALEECEFHHSDFKRGKDGHASSTVALVFHVANMKTGERFIVKGNLEVEWRDRRDGSGIFMPASIDATRMTVLGRAGKPPFQETVAFPLPEGFARPVVVYDLDGDGLSEILIPSRNVIYWNQGKGKFKPGPIHPAFLEDVTAAVIADFTGDGVADLLCAGRAPEAQRLTPDEVQVLLLIPGDKSGKFSGRPVRISPPDWELKSVSALSAGDVDGDGDLDLWVAQYRAPYVGGQMPTPYYDANDGFPSFLLINEGEWKFTDRTEAAGLAKKRFRRTFSSSLADLDDDGDLDLVTVNDYSGVDFHLNDGGGKFTNATDRMNDNRALFGMSHVFGDFNGDGAMDLYTVGMSSTTARRLEAMRLGRKEFPNHNQMRKEMGYGNRMYLQGPGHVFKQSPDNDQVARTGWSWGSTSIDFDNDGDRDLYVANGHVSGETAQDYCTTFWCHDIYSGDSMTNPVLDEYFHQTYGAIYRKGVSWNGFEHNNLFMNESGRRFLNVGFLMNVGLEGDCLNVVSEDLDADGHVDLLVAENTLFKKVHELHLLKNNWVGGNWIGVRLREEGPGLSPVGAKITVASKSGQQIQWVVTGDSYNAQHSNIKHFGLGADSRVDWIEVRWPNGKVKRMKHPPINRYHRIRP